MRSFAAPLLALIGFSAGCRRADRELFPITERSRWNYLVRTVNSVKDEVSYGGRVAVGDVNGYALKSDMGLIHVAWNGENLVTDQMAGSRMIPPLPILVPVSLQPSHWRGWIDSGDGREPAKATITSTKVKLPLHGISVDTTRTVVEIQMPQHAIALINWYKSGVGLVRQEQRTDRRLDLILDYLDQT